MVIISRAVTEAAKCYGDEVRHAATVGFISSDLHPAELIAAF